MNCIFLLDNVLTVTDSYKKGKSNYIQRLNHIDCEHHYMTSLDAIEYAKNCRKCGFNDWRIATYSEAKHIFRCNYGLYELQKKQFKQFLSTTHYIFDSYSSYWVTPDCYNSMPFYYDFWLKKERYEWSSSRKASFILVR